MSVYNERQKRSIEKYLSKLKEIRFRVKPEEYAEMQKAAAEQGYSSMRQFFIAAINYKMNKKVVK